MPLIIPSDLVKKHGVFQAQNFVPIKYQDFIDRQIAYKTHNERIGRPKSVDLSKEPMEFYFDKADVLSVLQGDPNYLTFMFSCADSPKHEGLRVMMCGMDTPGYPVSDSSIFEGYKKGGSSISSNRYQFEVGRYLFKGRLDFFNDGGNWRGVKNNIKENAPKPDPFIYLLSKVEEVNRIGVYMADVEGKYNVMLVLSTGNFNDLLPISASGPNDYQAYDNSTQCCQ